MKKFIELAIKEWYKKEYGDENIIYNDTLTKKENIHCSKINTPFGDLYHHHVSPPSKGCSSTIFVRLEDENIDITKDNIHLYYQFMGGKDMKKYGYILDNIFDIRLDTLKKVFFNIEFEQLSSNTEYSFNITGLIVFGVKDTLKPIDEYIEEIKSSDAYKEYISKKS